MAKQRCGGKGKSGRRSPLHGGQDESVGEFKSVGRQQGVKEKRRRAAAAQRAERPGGAQGAAATLVVVVEKVAPLAENKYGEGPRPRHNHHQFPNKHEQSNCASASGTAPA